MSGITRTYNMTVVPLTEDRWIVKYDGGGKIQFSPDGKGDLIFQPQTASTSAQTFAALLLLKDTIQKPLKNYAVKIEVTTEKQLRSSTPNDWEVFWFFGNYQQGIGKEKTANYFILKPNSGAELGRVYQEIGQQFLKTDEAVPLKIGERATFIIVKEQDHFQVYKNGEEIIDYRGRQMPESLYDQAGALGLYTEDAVVRVHSFAYQAL